LIVAALGLAGVIAFGGPAPPPPLVSIRDAVLKRDRTDFAVIGDGRQSQARPTRPLVDRGAVMQRF
jgi:hypothetical protein